MHKISVMFMCSSRRALCLGAALFFGVAFMMVHFAGCELAVEARVLDRDAGVMPDCRGWVDLCGWCLEDRGTSDAGVIGMAGTIHRR